MTVPGLLAVLSAGVVAALMAGGSRALLPRRLGPPRNRTGRPPLTTSERRPWWFGRRRRRPVEREAEVAEACLAVSAELNAGAPVAGALAAVCQDWPDLLAVPAGRAAIGGDVAAALREMAKQQPGAAALGAVAAGWEVTEQTGAPLSRVLVAVADALRAEAAVRQEAHTQLATVRTTARLLAVLPFGTLVLLSGGGGAGIRFLVSSPYGWACLAAALMLVGAGLWWVDRLARSATRSVWQR